MPTIAHKDFAIGIFNVRKKKNRNYYLKDVDSYNIDVGCRQVSKMKRLD